MSLCAVNTPLITQEQRPMRLRTRFPALPGELHAKTRLKAFREDLRDSE